MEIVVLIFWILQLDEIQDGVLTKEEIREVTASVSKET